MESVLPVKVLAVVALVLLVSGASEGLVLRKCELKNQLEAAGFQVNKIMGEKLSEEDFIARLVCNVENTSEFNTSLITSIQINQDDSRPPVRPPFRPPQRPKMEEPSTKEEDAEKMKEEHIMPVQPRRNPKVTPGKFIPGSKIISSEVQREKEPIWTWRFGLFQKKPIHDSSGDSSEESSEEDSSGDSSEEERDDGITWNLFGIFQLSDRVACHSGSGGSLNLCGLECSDLINDDITDDITCLKTLAESRGKLSGFSPKKKFLTKMMAMLFVKECRSVIPSEYFAECS